MSTVTDRIGGVATALAIKAPVRVATGGNVTLSGLQTIDGVALATGDRVLVMSQTTASENGIYQADTSSWTRALDFAGNSDVAMGTTVYVTAGSANANTWWRVTTANPVLVGSSSIAFSAGVQSDSSYLTFLQSGAGAVADTVQGALRDLPFVNLLDFCSAAKRTTILAGTQTDVTAELVLAAATRKVIVGPKGSYEISSPVSIESDMHFAGADDDYSKFVLTGTGQLKADQPRIHWSGMWIQSAVNNLTFVKVNQAYFRFDNFVLQTTGNNQVGIEMATPASPGGLAFCSFDKFLINSTTGVGFTAVKTTGSGYCNGNKFGEFGDAWQSFTTAIDVQNTGGFQVNAIGGYFETSVNPSQLLKANAGATVEDNVLTVHIDAGGGATCYAVNNNTGTVGRNSWLGLAPEFYLTTGSAALVQMFTEKIFVRAYRNTDQTLVADATFVKIAFDTVTFDTSGLTAFVVGTNRFVAPRAMRVRVYAKTNIGGNLATTNPLYLSIYKNGLVAAQFRTFMPDNSAPDLTVSDTIALVKNDYIEAFARADGSGTHTISGSTDTTFICIEEL